MSSYRMKIELENVPCSVMDSLAGNIKHYGEGKTDIKKLDIQEEGVKTCNECHVKKPVEDFSKGRGKCKPCRVRIEVNRQKSYY